MCDWWSHPGSSSTAPISCICCSFLPTYVHYHHLSAGFTKWQIKSQPFSWSSQCLPAPSPYSHLFFFSYPSWIWLIKPGIQTISQPTPPAFSGMTPHLSLPSSQTFLQIRCMPSTAALASLTLLHIVSKIQTPNLHTVHKAPRELALAGPLPLAFHSHLIHHLQPR